MELTTAQVEQLTAGLDTAVKGIADGRKEMEACNTRVAELIAKEKQLSEGVSKSDDGLKLVQSEMEKLANKMIGLAEQHTTLLNNQRTMIQSAPAGADVSDRVFKAHNGVIWQSRRQAEEVGVFLMATMKRDMECKRHARRWLQENKAGLRYLPNIPKSFVEELGNDWLKKMDEVASTGFVQTLTGGSTPGSVLVRPEFATALVRNVEQYGVFRQEATIWPMGSDTVYIPRQKSTNPTIYWEGEGEAGTAQDPSFDLLAMNAKKMLMLHQASNELTTDAAVSLASIVMEFFSRGIAYEEDRIGFNGDGTGGGDPGFAGFVGVLGATRNGDTYPYGPIAVTGAAGNNLSTEVTEAKLRAMVGNLHTWASNAAWYMHRTILADLCAIQQGTAGGPVVQFLQGQPAQIMGYRVRLAEAMPTASDITASEPAFALGDLRKGWILGDRLQMELETSEHYAFNTDLLTTRVKARIGFLQVQGNAMVVYVTGTA